MKNKFRYIGCNISGKIFKAYFTLIEIENQFLFDWIKKNNIVQSSLLRDRWIGKYDINNQEIYENDCFEDEVDEILSVQWDKELLTYYLSDINGDGDEIALYNIEGMEICGNMHGVRI